MAAGEEHGRMMRPVMRVPSAALCTSVAPSSARATMRAGRWKKK
ncbi:MAG: hypothetical protein NTZ50_06290 [Chloroflexi bacterium]|nr:hypothetical protein [Chloroflexota bacterium]